MLVPLERAERQIVVSEAKMRLACVLSKPEAERVASRMGTMTCWGNWSPPGRLAQDADQQ